MKRITLTVLILLLLALTFPSVPKTLTTTTNLRWVTPGSPDVPTEPMPANFTTDDYLNTTNPYADFVDAQGALDEVDDVEGYNPLYVLVFGDEEERQNWYDLWPYSLDWKGWAKLQLERGDEALVANFGIDIRILGFEEWDSDDSIEYMTHDDEWDLCDELLADKGHYLRTWYEGESWSNRVDVIVGITDQATPADQIPTYGVAPGSYWLDRGIVFVLLKWQVYWKDDNLVQHEVSHLYYADDDYRSQPPAPCCAMAHHPHYHSYILEDGYLWWVWADDPCAYTAYFWCTDCNQTIHENSDRYPIHTLTITTSPSGTTDPTPRTYAYRYGTSVTVKAFPYPDYEFDYWILGTIPWMQWENNPITFTITIDEELTAYFKEASDGDDGNFYHLTIRRGVGGLTDPEPGYYPYPAGTAVWVYAYYIDYAPFMYWLLDGVRNWENPILVIMDCDHTLTPYFDHEGEGGGSIPHQEE